MSSRPMEHGSSARRSQQCVDHKLGPARNSIGESGAQALADMLLVNTTLTELDVSQQKEELSDTAKERLRVAWGQRPENALLR